MMLKKRDIQRIESKEREFDLVIRATKRHFIKKWESLKVKFRLELRRVLSFILFYRPTDKLDRNWHIFEMVIFYIILQYAWKGLVGR